MERIWKPTENCKRNVLCKREKTIEEIELMFDKLRKYAIIVQELEMSKLIMLGCRTNIGGLNRQCLIAISFALSSSDIGTNAFVSEVRTLTNLHLFKGR